MSMHAHTARERETWFGLRPAGSICTAEQWHSNQLTKLTNEDPPTPNPQPNPTTATPVTLLEHPDQPGWVSGWVDGLHGGGCGAGAGAGVG